MAIRPATTIVNSPQFSAVGVGQCHGRMIQLQARPVRLCAQSSLHQRIPVKGSSRMQSTSVICAAALNARCGAEQTQTVTIKAPTITHLPGKEKSPSLDDGNSGFPPRGDDGDGDDGDRGDGGKWSGGFGFFGFLLFLSFLKDKESEGGYRDNRRR